MTAQNDNARKSALVALASVIADFSAVQGSENTASVRLINAVDDAVESGALSNPEGLDAFIINSGIRCTDRKGVEFTPSKRSHLRDGHAALLRNMDFLAYIWNAEAAYGGGFRGTFWNAAMHGQPLAAAKRDCEAAKGAAGRKAAAELKALQQAEALAKAQQEQEWAEAAAKAEEARLAAMSQEEREAEAEAKRLAKMAEERDADRPVMLAKLNNAFALIAGTLPQWPELLDKLSGMNEAAQAMVEAFATLAAQQAARDDAARKGKKAA